MLSLVINIPLKRRTFLERLHLCRKEKIVKESFNLKTTGEINVYKIYHFSKKPFWEKERLESELRERLYCSYSDIPEEYLKEGVILRLIEVLKKEKGKTVYLNKSLCDTPHLATLCRYAKRVYIESESLPKNAEEIYKSFGTLPVVCSFPANADLYPDISTPFFVKLPKEAEDIRPKEFSPTLFAGLIYKENGLLII